MIHLWPWVFSIILSLGLIWIPEVPLGQDGPQHLYMGHLFSLGPESFKAYIFPQSISPYQSFSRIISFFPSPIIGAKVLLSITFLGLSGVWYHFVRNKEVSPLWSLPLFWSPILFMGFWPFLMTLPFLLYGFIKVVNQEKMTVKECLITFIGCLLFHQLSLILITLMILFQRIRTKVLVATLTGLALLILAGVTLSSLRETLILKESLIANDGFTFFESWIKIKWTSPIYALTYIAHFFCGPFWYAGFIFPFFFLSQKMRDLSSFWLVCLAVLLMVPFSVEYFYKLSFLNFRLLFFLVAYFALNLSLKFSNRIITAFLLIYALSLGVAHYQFIEDLNTFNKNEKLLYSKASLGVLDLRKDQGFVADQYHLQHFNSLLWAMGEKKILPGQFWAGFSSHLPFSYKKEFRKLSAIPDWEPKNFELKDANSFDMILLRKANERDSIILRELSKQREQELNQWGVLISCFEGNCLFRPKGARLSLDF